MNIILLIKCQVFFFTLDSNSLYSHIQGFNSKIGVCFIVDRLLYYDDAPNGILKSLSSLIPYKKFFLNYNKNDRRFCNFFVICCYWKASIETFLLNMKITKNFVALSYLSPKYKIGNDSNQLFPS